MQQIVSDISMARCFVNNLFLVRIKDQYIHIVARFGKSLKKQPKPNLLQKSNDISSVQQRLALGGSVKPACWTGCCYVPARTSTVGAASIRWQCLPL